MLTQDILRRLWPRAPASTVSAIARVSDRVFAEADLTAPLRVAHFMAQISHECGGGTIVRENMNYSARRLMEVFGVGRHSAKITEAEATALANHPQMIAERVYGLGNLSKARELGNTQPGDGWKYRGNGMLQLTGRASHRRIGRLVDVDLEANPELLEDAATSFRVAAMEFAALNCIPAADADDVVLVTRRVNGGRNGLAERQVWLRRWKQALDGVDEPPKAPRAAPNVEAKPLMSSRIMQGVTGTAVSLATAGGAKVAEQANTSTSTVSLQDVTDKIQQASDTITTITAAKDSAVVVVQTVKPFLGLAPTTWALIAGVAFVVAVVAVAFTGWERWKKLRDQGV